jgi:uncharacterized protein YjiS (DUF1127 family)
MSVAETAKHQPIVSYLDSGLASLLASAFRRIAAWRTERNAVRRLSNYPDAMLKDIGLTRGEIPDLVRHGRPENLKVHPDVINRH